MPKLDGKSNWFWWVAGALATAVVVFASYGLMLPPQLSDTHLNQFASSLKNPATGHPSGPAAHAPEPAVQSSQDGNEEMGVRPDDSLSLGIDPPNLYDDGMIGEDDELEAAMESFDSLHERVMDDPDHVVRLAGIEAAISLRDKDSFDLLWLAVNSDGNADNRLSAVSELEQMIINGLGDSVQILELLEDTAGDTDPRVAELAQLIIQEQFGGPEQLPQVDEEEEEELSDDETVDYLNTLETDEEKFYWIRNSVLFDPDSAVRLGGIEAITDPDENSFDLLREAALNDFDPDNRLSAVSNLENMLRSDAGDREQILQLLQNSARDPDPRVAELSELIIQEQYDDI